MKHFVLYIILAVLLTNCKSTTNTNESLESSTEVSETCVITCPHCGHKETETLPTEVCQIKYTCTKCQKVLTPEGDDCCVFCTHSTHKCPSKQEE